MCVPEERVCPPLTHPFVGAAAEDAILAGDGSFAPRPRGNTPWLCLASPSAPGREEGRWVDPKTGPTISPHSEEKFQFRTVLVRTPKGSSDPPNCPKQRGSAEMRRFVLSRPSLSPASCDRGAAKGQAELDPPLPLCTMLRVPRAGDERGTPSRGPALCKRCEARGHTRNAKDSHPREGRVGCYLTLNAHLPIRPQPPSPQL
ncbi:uncharacterized protein LOC135184896 isoform X2 [Pogoniulus pusillus]|uniref:uncharacterized protein LOC135184896 isoform X2 n=1 Tax=Pogoniulus pusillus TaxID=488313 RepID=UPI0030B94379